MKPSVSTRLTTARQHLGLSQREFAKSLNVSNSTVSVWESGKIEVSNLSTQGIEKTHGISAHWLLTGEGEMMVNAKEAKMGMGLMAARIYMSGKKAGDLANEIADGTLLDPPNKIIGFSPIPLIPLTSVTTIVDVDLAPVRAWIQFDDQWLKMRIGISSNDLFLVEIECDNMTTTLWPGDLVMIDRTASNRAFQNGLWVFSLGNAVHLMRLQQTGASTYQASGDNPAYSAITLNDPPELIGKVVWSDRRW